MVLASLLLLLNSPAWAGAPVDLAKIKANCKKSLPALAGFEDSIEERCEAVALGSVKLDEVQSWGKCAGAFHGVSGNLRLSKAELHRSIDYLCEKRSNRQELEDQSLPVLPCVEQLRNTEKLSIETAIYICLDQTNRETLVDLRSCIHQATQKKEATQGPFQRLDPMSARDIIAEACMMPSFRTNKQLGNLAHCLNRLEALDSGKWKESTPPAWARAWCPSVSRETPESQTAVAAYVSCVRIASQSPGSWWYQMSVDCSFPTQRDGVACKNGLHQLTQRSEFKALSDTFDPLKYMQASDLCAAAPGILTHPETLPCVRELGRLVPELQTKLAQDMEQAEALIQQAPEAHHTQIAKKLALVRAEALAGVLDIPWRPDSSGWAQLDTVVPAFHEPSWNQPLSFCSKGFESKTLFSCIRERITAAAASATDSEFERFFKDGVVEPCLAAAAAKQVLETKKPEAADPCAH